MVRRASWLLAARAAAVVGATSGAARLARGASIEVSPAGARQLVDEKPPRRVFVNMVATEAAHFEAVVEAVRALRSAGHEPVPHVPAAVLRDEAEARRWLERLAAAGAAMPLVVGGNRDQIGLDANGVARAAAGLFDRLAFAAFPEGHPRLGRTAGELSLENKLEIHPKANVVTQWSADAGRVGRWLGEFCSRYPDAEVHVGVPGPGDTAQLARFAAACGVVLEKEGPWSPEALLEAYIDVIADILDREPFWRLRLHVFPLGGDVAPTLAFLRKCVED